MTAPAPPPAMERRAARLLACVEARPDASVWEVELEGEPVAPGAPRPRAVAYPALVGPLRPGDRVLLNTTAVRLGLGTGGLHFVIARLGPQPEDGAPDAPLQGDAGHILKLRYTPLQLRVLAAEEEASPHRAAIESFSGLDGAPVLAAELHSQAAAAAVAARAEAPELRLAWVQLDTAALPLAFSRLVPRLRAEGVLDATVTVGQAFGGDFEAINIYSGLIVARAAAGADLILVTQGPGNVGTGTEFGFGGLALVEALHACDTFGGTALLAPRLSAADPRARHRGLSRHTRTLLRCLRAPALLPAPPEVPAQELPGPLPAGARWLAADPGPWPGPLEPYRDALTTMGRRLEEDPLFFRAAAAAGRCAARLAQTARRRNREKAG